MEEGAGKQDGIKIDFGTGGVGGMIENLLAQAEKLAESTGDEGAKERVAEIKRRLGGLGGSGEEDAGIPVIGSGLNLGGLLGGLLGSREEEGGFGGIFGLIDRIQQMQGEGGEGGTHEFTIPGGRAGIFHVKTGGGTGSVRRGGMHTRFGSAPGSGGEESDFQPKPVNTNPSGVNVNHPVAQTDFNLEMTEADGVVMVFGTVPTVENESEISCEVIEDGTQLMIIVKGNVHTVELPVPVEVNPEDAKASLSNGLFSITLKKVEEEPS